MTQYDPEEFSEKLTRQHMVVHGVPRDTGAVVDWIFGELALRTITDFSKSKIEEVVNRVIAAPQCGAH